MPSLAKTFTISLMLSFALVGAYGSLVTAILHGFLDALRDCVTGDPEGACILDMSASVPPKAYTGIPAIDNEIGILFEFFAQGLMSHSDKFDLEAFLAVSYTAALFGGAWFLMALEGLRRGSSGTILRWTGSFGIVFQAVTSNLIAPIYFIIQLLLDPASSNPTAALADPTDLELLPVVTFISFVLPTLGLAMPRLNILDTETCYAAIAFWHPFPLYQSVLHPVIRAVFGRGGSSEPSSARQKKAVDRAYRFILGLTMGVHLLVVGAIAASSIMDQIPTMSPSEIFALTPLEEPPTLALLNPPVSALSSRLIVTSFLRWDVYGTCASVVVWAAYQWQAVQETSRLVAMLFKIVFWTVLGGPLTPAIMFLWERDSVVLSRASRSKKAKKSK